MRLLHQQKTGQLGDSAECKYRRNGPSKDDWYSSMSKMWLEGCRNDSQPAGGAATRSVTWVTCDGDQEEHRGFGVSSTFCSKHINPREGPGSLSRRDG